MLNKLKKTAVVLSLIATAAVSASPLFDGSNADLWLVDKNTGAVTGYDYNKWLGSFAATGLPLDANEYAIVNNVMSSSQAMTPAQPLISLAGLEAGNPDTADSVQSQLLVEPASGDYTQTINVRIMVDKSLVEAGGASLSWQVEGKALQTLALEPTILTAATLSNGYFVQTLTVIIDTNLSVTLKAADGSTLGGMSRSYTISSTHADGFRRDTDGDGLPDMVEAAIGLDALNSDWQHDSDDNGWSDFDEWLRSDDIDPLTELPRDTDKDGWSDFDEQLRGTDPNDPQPVLAVSADSEIYRQEVRRYKDFPAARSLYEVESLVQAAVLSPQPALSGMQWSQARADDIFAQPYFDSNALLTDSEIVAAGLNPADVNDRLRAAMADAAMLADQLPVMRLPAASSMVITALHEKNNISQVYKYWLKRRADLTPQQFYSSEGVGSWNTAEEWKTAYIAFLGSGLVQQEAVTLDRDVSTATVNLLEAFISHEARLHNTAFADIQLFGSDAYPLDDALVRSTESALKYYPGFNTSLDDVIDTLSLLTANGQPLSNLKNQVINILANPVNGVRTDRSVAEYFIKSFDESSFECYVESAYIDQLNTPGNEQALAQFNIDCPVYTVVADPLASEAARLQGLLATDQQRRYLLRLLLIPGGYAQYQLDQAQPTPTLADMLADTDADGADNKDELFTSLANITLPWAADTDGDGIADGVDSCPLDIENLCSLTPVLPLVKITAAATVYEPASGNAFVLLSIVLDKPSDSDVIVRYQTVTDQPDTTADATDIVGVSDAQVVIAAGETVALIKVYINADSETEGAEQFKVRVTSVENANLSIFSSAVVTINDPLLLPTGDPPVVAAVPVLSFEPVKIFRFSWSDVPDATYYKLLENIDGTAGFTQVASDVQQGVGQLDYIVPLYARTTAEYILQSCNAGGCTDSASISVAGTLAGSVGYFKSSSPWSGRKFGSTVSLSSDGMTMAVGSYDRPESEVIVFSKQTGIWIQQARFLNSQTADYFGHSVSLSDDGNTLAVGAFDAANASSLQSGAVYVYTRTGDTWGTAVRVKVDYVGNIPNDSTGQSDIFGFSVSLSGDGNTLAAGAYKESSNATGINGDWSNDTSSESGAVYIFTRIGSSWGQVAYVKASNTGNGDHFGYSVDLNKDGTTLAVGARFEDSNATMINGDETNDLASQSGAVYIFTFDTAWSQQSYIKATNSSQEDHFGLSVALSDDGNTLAVGANNNDTGTVFATGAAYVFTRNADTWSEQAFIKPDFTIPMQFGGTITISGDGNILAVGAPFEDSNAVALDGDNTDTSLYDSGAVFVYTRSTGSWSKQAYVKASNTDKMDYFGNSVSISADGDTLAVGATGEDAFVSGINGDQSDNVANNAGAVYVY